MILFVSTDLMLGSQLSFAARRESAELQTAATRTAIEERVTAEPPRLVLIDLNTPNLDLAWLIPYLGQLSPRPKLVAYGPHVHLERLDEARQLGCDQVLSRGQFSAQMGQIVAGAAQSGKPKAESGTGE